jgi:hypothetical protein
MADVDVSPSYQNNTNASTNGYTNGNNINNNTNANNTTTTTIEEVDFDGGNSTARLFERTRIQVLADEREHVQKKNVYQMDKLTFTPHTTESAWGRRFIHGFTRWS